MDPGVQAVIDGAVAAIGRLGGTIVEASLPALQHGISAYYLVAPSEASSNLARFDGVHYGRRCSRAEGFGPEVTRRILLGTFALSSGYYDAYYLKAMRARRRIKEDFDRVFGEADLIVGPTSPTPPFRFGERTNDPLAMYLSDVFTVAANLAGIPAMSIPCGFTADGLPVGLQLHAPARADARLFRAARAIERELGVAPATADA